MLRNIAHALSYFLHPSLMPLYFYSIVFFIIPSSVFRLDQVHKLYFLFFIAVVTLIIPLFCVMTLKITGHIESFKMPYRKERQFPFLLTLICYVTVTFLLLRHMHAYRELVFPMIVITSGVLLLVIINSFWKISAHAIGISGVMGMLTRFSFFQFGERLTLALVFVALLSGLLLSARVFLKAHTIQQVYIGFVVGFVSSLTLSIILF